MMIEQQYQFGIIGLGVMGSNFAQNIAERGFSVIGFDKDSSKVEAMNRLHLPDRLINATDNIQEFINHLTLPRTVLFLLPAGKIVDDVIRELIPFLQPGDLLIDGGNSHFKDTDLRMKTLAEKNLLYMGLGISGGEEGARRGPSLMPGGPKEAYDRVRPIFEAAAASVSGLPCTTYLGPGSAGHYVKMVHNGIEYGLMELIAESYNLMKHGLALSDDELADVYQAWNDSQLNSYLIEITAHIFRQVDDRTGKRLIDLILDEAKQKGTGMWTSQDAMDNSIAIPTIDSAVAMRNLSTIKTEREFAAQILSETKTSSVSLTRVKAIYHIQQSLLAAIMITYAQGFSMLQRASSVYGFQFNLAEVARIWRGGCIIRSALLENIQQAYQDSPSLANILAYGQLAHEVLARLPDVREIIRIGIDLGVPLPGFMASLAYIEAYRSAWLPANLIQAQRDYFGAHTYEREDAKGVFHTHWE